MATEIAVMTTRVRRFYLLALWTPLIAPAIAAGCFALQGGGSFTGPLASAGMLLLMSLLTTGLPYAVVAVWATWWLLAPARSESAVRRLMWRAPLVVAAFAIPTWIAMGVVERSVLNGLGASVIFLPYLLVIGYMYVTLTAIINEVLRRAGFLRDVGAVAAT